MGTARIYAGNAHFDSGLTNKPIARDLPCYVWIYNGRNELRQPFRFERRSQEPEFRIQEAGVRSSGTGALGAKLRLRPAFFASSAVSTMVKHTWLCKSLVLRFLPLCCKAPEPGGKGGRRLNPAALQNPRSAKDWAKIELPPGGAV